jgi:hypothetical protein
MRIQHILASFLLMSSLFCLTACHKTVDGPTVTITSPAADDQFANDLIVKIKGEVTDASKLHSLTIKITDDKSGAVLFTKSPAVYDLTSYTFSEAWTAKVADWVDATVTVTAENHAGEITTQTVKIKIWL